MQIDISPVEQEQLAAFAARRGFRTPEEYASSIIVNTIQLEAFAALPPDELAESVRSIERGLSDKEAGRGQPARSAMDDIADEFGFKISR